MTHRKIESACKPPSDEGACLVSPPWMMPLCRYYFNEAEQRTQWEVPTGDVEIRYMDGANDKQASRSRSGNSMFTTLAVIFGPMALVFGGLLNLSSHADSYPFDQELPLLHELILAYVNR